MIRIPTLDELHDFAIAVAKAVLPTRDWTRRKPGWKFVRVLTTAVTYISAQLKSALDDLLPDTAEGNYLDRWGVIFGVPRKGATPARKAGALRVRGTLASTVVIGDVLTHVPSGLRFQINENAAIPAALYIDVAVVGLDTGEATRLEKDDVLTFDAPPTGIEEDAILWLDLDEGGEDAELDGPYRTRILARLATPPLGGAPRDYVQWATAVTGIVSAYAYPIRAGLGTVDLAALHDGTGADRLLSPSEITDLQALIDELKPASVLDFRVLTVEETPVDVEITLITNGESRYSFDWNDATPLVVLTWTLGTLTMVFTTDRPASMEAGMRFTIKPTGGSGDGVQHTISALSGTDGIVLEEAPVLAPVATDTVYSGGALVDEVRDAVIAHIDELGTSNTDAHIYGTWEANLRPENLYRVSQSVVGVRKSTVITPAVTVEPADNAYPDDEIVFMLSPRRILIRKEW